MSLVLASRVGVDLVASEGQILGGGQSFVRIGGSLWTVLGDAIGLHGGGGGHTSTFVSGAVAWITIGGLAVCIAGSVAGCAHITTGSGHVAVEVP